MRDMFSNFKVLRVIEPKAVGTTGAANGALSAAIDRKGFQSVDFIILHGTAGATGDTTTPVVLESDASTGGFTSVADADLIGTEAGAGLPAQATARTSGVGQNIATKLSYRGNKRYLKLRLYGLGHATGLVAAAAILGNPDLQPISGQTG